MALLRARFGSISVVTLFAIASWALIAIVGGLGPH